MLADNANVPLPATALPALKFIIAVLIKLVVAAIFICDVFVNVPPFCVNELALMVNVPALLMLIFEVKFPAPLFFNIRPPTLLFTALVPLLCAKEEPAPLLSVIAPLLLIVPSLNSIVPAFQLKLPPFWIVNTSLRLTFAVIATVAPFATVVGTFNVPPLQFIAPLMVNEPVPCAVPLLKFTVMVDGIERARFIL